MEIIPAIDIIDAKCVRLTQGDYAQKSIYNENPLEVAKHFEGIGIKRLHLVDLDGAKKGEVVNWKVLEQIANKTNLVIDFGGGVKTEDTIKSIFNAGASIVTIGSMAVKHPEKFYLWLNQFGSEKILLGADVKNELITIAGWSETTEINIFDFIQKNTEMGLTQLFCTDVAKDGMLEGPSAELYKKIIDKYPTLKFIASGGVSSMKDVDELKSINCKGVIIGKAIYEGKITMQELTKFISNVS
jgi:phosphoribosylformimino-5-aminoimidazole carboxamide ribotide isomerase